MPIEPKVDLRPGAQRLEVMNFLNEVAGRHPAAVSFASGRPAEQFFDMAAWTDGWARFSEHLASVRKMGIAEVGVLIAQYGPTSGLIQDLVARQVEADEGVRCHPEQVIVTSGAQEAIDLCVRVLCESPEDVVISRSPTYIGITGSAFLNRREIVPLAPAAGELEAQALRRLLAELRQAGRRGRLLYLSPDYGLGEMPAGAAAIELIEVCAEHGVTVLEDNPYSGFRYEGDATTALFSAPGQSCVIYIGTYSKTICPAVRTGCLVVPPRLHGDAGGASALRQALVQAKSFVTVNSSQLMQAVVAGVLLRHGGTLAPLVRPIADHYRRARDEMLGCLERSLGELRPEVDWTVPRAGFFLTMSLPFPFDGDASLTCATDYGVIVTPLSFFALDQREDRKVRLAFSNVAPAQIRLGIERFARYVRETLAHAQRQRASH